MEKSESELPHHPQIPPELRILEAGIRLEQGQGYFVERGEPLELPCIPWPRPHPKVGPDPLLIPLHNLSIPELWDTMVVPHPCLPIPHPSGNFLEEQTQEH